MLSGTILEHSGIILKGVSIYLLGRISTWDSHGHTDRQTYIRTCRAASLQAYVTACKLMDLLAFWNILEYFGTF